MVHSLKTPKEFCTPPPSGVEPNIANPDYRIPRGRAVSLRGGGFYDRRINEIRHDLEPNVGHANNNVYESASPFDRGTTSENDAGEGFDPDKWDLSVTEVENSSREDRTFEFEIEDPFLQEGETLFDKTKRNEKEREEKWRDPNHENQKTLDKFEGRTQETSPDAVEHNKRLDGLPVYLPDDEIPDVHINDPNRSGPDYCNQCGARQPWSKPLERGVNALRRGNGRDGNPCYDHCDPNETNVRSCDCCGCPRCAAKSIRHRKTKTPSWACNNPNCGIEFRYPIKRPNDTDKRDCLYWECRSCGEPTQAPFPGIPEELLQETK